MRCVLGLDLSLTNTGVAVLDLATAEPRLLRALRTAPRDGSKIERADWIAESIAGLLSQYSIHLIVIENYAWSRVSQDLAELGGLVKRELWRATGVSECWIYVQPNTVKKFATGSGGADKHDMLAAARPVMERYGLTGVDLKDHNLADAYWIAKWGRDNAYDAS